MATYSNAPDDAECASAGRTVFVGNIGLVDFEELDKSVTNPATSMLSIDVISSPGTSEWLFHFVTLELVIQAPEGARFVNHSQRGNYHRELRTDPAALIKSEPDAVYWVESNEPGTTLRIREDATARLSSLGNGRTYYVGLEGLDTGAALQVSVVAAGSLVRESTCHIVLDDLHPGDRLPGYLD